MRVLLGVLACAFLSISLFVKETSKKVRLLTPRGYIDPEKGLADTTYMNDPTLGVDDHLSACWNNDRYATLHEASPERRAFYEKHFSNDHVWRFSHNPMPEFFTVSGNYVGVMLDMKRFDMISMSLWNQTFTYGVRTNPPCLQGCVDPPVFLPTTTRVLVGKLSGVHSLHVGTLWPFYSR